MSSLDINKMENEEESKTPDKKQIEAEEKEVMLKSENETAAADASAELKDDGEGPVKAALSGDVTEQGREVKPKFIPIGAIKMPGFFTRNSAEKEKSKEDEAVNEKDGDGEKEEKPKRHRLQFLHSCFFTQFMHHPQNENEDGNQERRRRINFNLKYPKIFQRHSPKDPEAALASMETLDDKLDTPTDGMENVKLDTGEPEEGKVATKLPLKERIRQKKFIIDDIVVCVVVALVLLAVIIGVCIGARAGPPAERPLRLGKFITTITTCGPVEGIRDEDVYKFYSIPYAVPPVGERRFTYAQPLNELALCWNGTRAAWSAGPRCLQLLENGTLAGDEDCLTLDVVTPHVRYDAPLPVVLLVDANSPWGGVGPAQPSAMYARTKEVVFVRPNFRLGPFGFLALDILSDTKYPKTSGNYALSDLLAALRWVQLNIQHFGGDPASVTLLGHRAGATLAAALTATPRAHRLYARAWLSSPSAVFPTEPLEEAQKRFEPFKRTIKCEDAACLRRKEPTDILAAVPDVWMVDDTGILPQEDEPRFSWLVLDGDLLRAPVDEVWRQQRQAKDEGKERAYKPLVLGTTLHAGHSEPLRRRHLNWTAADVERAVNASAVGRALGGAAFEHVARSYAGLAELLGGVRVLCPLLRVAAARGEGRAYVAGGAGGALAGLSADVEAMLGTFDSEGAEQRRYMAAMQQLFYYFVWHGQLAGPAAPLLAVAQDPLPLAPPPLCAALEQARLVPQYAHRD